MVRKIHPTLLMFSFLILGLWGLMPSQAMAKPLDDPSTVGEIVNLFKIKGCSGIEDFNKGRKGINPPYLYAGISLGSGGIYSTHQSTPSANGISSAFLCERKDKQKRRFFLIVFLTEIKSKPITCPSEIEINHFPGGLSLFPPEGLPIFSDNKWNLKDFRYMDHPDKTGPDSPLEHDGILESYETGTIYYCYKGNWLFYSYD